MRIVGYFGEYTSLAVSIDKILVECVFSKLKKSGIKFSKETGQKVSYKKVYIVDSISSMGSPPMVIYLKGAVKILIQ